MNTAKVIPFRKPQVTKQEAGNMYSDKFAQGYVMSSRLYRKEVWPFLSDAARNVYAELENRINGHNKESDFVSWSQLQGGEVKGSRKMSLSTVKVGLAMLLANKIVSVVATGKQGIKKYQLHEVSLVDKKIIKPSEKEASKYFGNSSTSETVVLQKPKQTTSETVAPTTSETGDTIDNPLDLLENKKKNPLVDNSENEMFGDSVKYHGDDKKQYSLRELANVYTVQTDLAEQAKRIDPKFDDAKILSELKNFAQWSTSREKTTAQGWMNYWIYRIQKLVEPKAKSQKTTKAKSKSLSDAQINYFVSELCNYSTFASLYSNVGETQKSFEARISANLRKPEYAKTYGPYLAELGFVVDLGPEL
ncbi:MULTISPECIES: hypothetical protein [Acinetobacter]|uniref:hypothetical protein n=1 Tax=Acinetobacter TaxID=469 RepID=UPI000EA33849|nr:MULTISPECIES: hypothetical protein [Acinetobacter]RKG45146.1 hypothetical protein D7V51_05790 [Acinetobacter cumulans]RZG60116.1 hypothetical protein EXE29_06340 [Acinetobacter sp. WCHAc060006]